MISRRELLKASVGAGAVMVVPGVGCGRWGGGVSGIEVNDVQSRLNATRVERIVRPTTVDEIAAALRAVRRERGSVCVAGGRHAMGGQQFARGRVLLDMTGFGGVVGFDREAGTIEVEAGIEWPELIDYLYSEQGRSARAWGIRDKQTGVDRVSIGGSLSANVHGRGLTFPPIIVDVESFEIMDADGEVRHCSRDENAELFSLAIGGYGLFGLITRVKLRLARRRKVVRVVEMIPVAELIGRVEQRIEAGFLYGDCQYATDLEGEAEFHPGVFSCYRPVGDETPIEENQRVLSGSEWAELYRLARTDKKRAFERYSEYYMSTSGQVYWSDRHQLVGNFDGYREAVDPSRGTEMITEVYVSKDEFIPFMSRCREDFVEHGVDMTYGTIRFIEADLESYLPWAREASVCIICNLHVVHTRAGIAKAAADFRRIIDRAIEFGGRYYLTYHRWAERAQVEACYPQLVDFLRLKRKYDPGEMFQSEWYQHYKALFGDVV